MKLYGFTTKELDTIKALLRQSSDNSNVEVYIFGSRARGDHRKYSDVDLLFVPTHNSSFDSKHIYRIANALEESNLPYKFDLVLNDDLAEGYRENIEKDKVLFLSL